MRYAPSERFWRNLLLTCVFTVCTLGFSVASYQGFKLNSPTLRPHDPVGDKKASTAPSRVPDALTTRAEYGRTSGAPLQELGPLDPVGTPVSFAEVEAGSGSAAVASDAGFGAPAGDRSRRGHSSSSSSGNAGSGSGKGFPGPSFGGGSPEKDELGRTTTRPSSPAASRKSNTKGDGRHGSGKKSDRSKKGAATETSTPDLREAGALGTLYADKGSPARSPAATPEPLSMILVGTGLVGLYGARKYLR